MQLYALNKPRVLKKDKSTEQVRYEAQFAECTFEPDLYKPPLEYGQPAVPDFDQTVERLQKAHARREQLFQFQENRF